MDNGGSDVGQGGTIAPPPIPNSCDPPAIPDAPAGPATVVGSGDGTCTEALLDAAIARGGNITFDCGATAATITVSGPKTLALSTAIDGGGKITISGGGAHRIFVTQGDVDLTIKNLTLADAFVDGERGAGPSDTNSGAAIYRQSNGRLVVVNSVFAHNHASDVGNDIAGGAIYSYGGDTVITGTTFDGNTAASGGAIGNLRSNLTIVNSIFVNNIARDQNGGAVALDGQNVDHGKVFTMCGVVVKNNRAHRQGGGVYRYGYPGESTVIDSSWFDGNSAEDPGGLGGGVYHHTDTPGAMPLTLTNSTISNNRAGGGAGGMFLFNAPVSLTNVTIADNAAMSSLGGGIAANGVTGTLKNCTIGGNHADNSGSFGGGIIGGGSLVLLNTIVANNTAGNAWNPVSCTEACAGGDHDLQHPPKRASGQDDGPCVAGIQFADPMLGPLMDNGGPTPTMALAAGSPAIGAGADCPATDQRGHARAGGCDIGAFQHDAP
jgi:hypothetical protein